ncbi:O-antigen ligase family protein [Methylobacterium nigriterrae]|uniref:O-antigen ligase family protein n=1 Tax=Methylobacterium nigriterrae TaxID=3127512 RepID=UPI0030136AA5
MTGTAARQPLMPTLATISLAAVAAALCVGAWIEQDYAALAIVLATLPLPVAIFATLQALNWNGRYAFYLGIAVIVLQCANLRVRDIDDKSIDGQILIKLACIALMTVMAATGMLKRAPVRQPADIVLWVLFLIYQILTSFISLQPQTALVETFSNLAAFLFLYHFARLLGADNLVKALIAACFILCVVSIAAYFLVPQLGRMSDWVNGAFVPTSRLQGVLGTANGAGAAAAIGILLTALLSGIPWRRPLFWVLVLPFAFCLVMSNNRMSLVAMGLAFAYVYLVRGQVGAKLTVGLLVASIGLLVFASFGDALLSSVSRSGSAEEITSGTGRTRIWAVVLELWTEQPLFGYGAGSAKFILPHHPLLFAAAAHAHNLYLNILFAGGAIGLVLFMLSLGATLRRLWSERAHAIIALLIFVLIYGLTEPTIGGLVAYLPISFFSIAFLSLARRQGRPKPAGPRASRSPFRFDDPGGVPA